ncbi:hypothetical protein H7J93_28235 [Mycobacterium barrassiae]|uniref:hypothetical protein n=1 Tax=Mycobacterium barrassiae TaxID=319709 RepID=UPI002265F9D5|nr:hypothetical protein [Mycobacterium barrassiae]MCV7303512.1 hypothetical protein [Mycobacterium barrassiae]
MPNLATYEASSIDWDRLNKYARRVANETRRPSESPIKYTTTEYVDVPKTVAAPGLRGLLGRTETKAARQQQQREVVVVGKHWLLDRRHHHIERNGRGKDYTNQETTHEQHYYVLLPDGSLKHVILWEEEFTLTSFGRTTFRLEKDHLVSDFGDGEIKAFDFEKRYSECGTHGHGTKTWGDREPGRRLLVHVKGVGLSRALKRLVPQTEQRAASASSPPSPPSRLRGSAINRTRGTRRPSG